MRTRFGFLQLELLVASLGILWAAPHASAQDVSLEVHTADGRSEYRVGELIALQMQFTSNSKSYIVDTAFRFPELQSPHDELLVDPAEGWDDPLAEYRRALSRSAFFDSGGGLRGFGRLGEKPVTLDLFLNRYVRFSKPGHYVVSIRDHRVSLLRTSANEPDQPIELTSSPLRLTISTASPEWEQQQLASALETTKKGPGVNVNACEIISSLNTPAAEFTMVDELTDTDERPCCGFSYALLGVRNRTLVLEHMQAQLVNPLASITPQFVDMMATLTLLEDGPDTDFFQRTSQARKDITGRLLALLNEKKGSARFAAISTLVSETLLGSQPGDSAEQTDILRVAVEIFDRLSAQAQATLLSAKWKDVSSPAMVPVLRRCAETDNTASCGRLQGDLLLARLQEVSPKDAREVILADMQKESPRFPASVLAMLPDKELPEMDAVLREHLESKNGNLDTTASLI